MLPLAKLSIFSELCIISNIFSVIYMDVRIEPGWKQKLAGEFDKPYFKALTDRVRADYANPGITVYPPGQNIFAAFDASPFFQTKVVIIGQDPYHGPGQANGLCFSVAPGVQMPPLLQIFSRRCVMTQVHLSLLTAISPDGHGRVCFF